MPCKNHGTYNLCKVTGMLKTNGKVNLVTLAEILPHAAPLQVVV